ncbi:DUF5610 domain-containing protein [Flocculibacter collagenilyticus]|uniref:DUF5610 domain-containing protein n=1 Tax=Flocculibacter collagenilyticus TaxID=2744479 RepID=UPI0018F53024|nr:DUF5610 domain-containing protein [Flocculibacter collagenilyticus]
MTPINQYQNTNYSRTFNVDQKGEQSSYGRNLAQREASDSPREMLTYQQSSNISIEANLLSYSKRSHIAGRVIDEKVSQKLAEKFNEVKEPSLTFDFKEVAKNVMSFVEGVITTARSDGASDDKLTSMFAQARAGIDEGFEQARAELEDLGMMDEELEEGIGKSYELIEKRLGKFEQEFFDKVDDDVNIGRPVTEDPKSDDIVYGRPVQPEAPISKPDNRETTPVEPRPEKSEPPRETFQPFNPVDNEQSVNRLRGYAQNIDYGLDQRSTIEIKTRDGDTVKVNFANSFTYSNSASQVSASSESNSVYSSSFGESIGYSEQFSYSVEGELSDDEKAALNSLLEDMAKVANQFFTGNVEDAFEEALELGFDQDQIAGFALNLQQVETVQMTQAYAAIGGQPTTDTQHPISSLSDYVKNLANTFDKGEALLPSIDEAKELLGQVTNQLLQYLQPESAKEDLITFSDINDRLLHGIYQNKNTDS